MKYNIRYAVYMMLIVAVCGEAQAECNNIAFGRMLILMVGWSAWLLWLRVTEE